MSKRWATSTLFEKDGQFNSITLVRFDTEDLKGKEEEKIFSYDPRNPIGAEREVRIQTDYIYYNVIFSWGFPPDKEDVIIDEKYKLNFVCKLQEIFKSEEEAFLSAKKAFEKRGHKNINTAIISSLFKGFK